MSLYHLGLIGSILSTVSYAESSLRSFARRTGSQAYSVALSPLVRSALSCSRAMPCLPLDWDFWVTLGLVLPSLTGLLWPFLGAKAQAPPN